MLAGWISVPACLCCTFCEVDPDVVFFPLSSIDGSSLDEGSAMGPNSSAADAERTRANGGSAPVSDAGRVPISPWCADDNIPLMDIFFPGGNCEWALPPLADAGAFDPSTVDVAMFDRTESSDSFGYVEGIEQCPSDQAAWYVDDPARPTKIIACPAICYFLKSLVNSNIRIRLGCEDGN